MLVSDRYYYLSPKGNQKVNLTNQNGKLFCREPNKINKNNQRFKIIIQKNFVMIQTYDKTVLQPADGYQSSMVQIVAVNQNKNLLSQRWILCVDKDKRPGHYCIINFGSNCGLDYDIYTKQSRVVQSDLEIQKINQVWKFTEAQAD